MNDINLLIEQEIPRLRRYAFGLVGDRDAADDLVQDCLERAIRKRHQWRRRGSIRSWLYKILYNGFLNSLKWHERRGRHIDIDDPGIAPATAANQEHQVACREIGEAMQHLPSQQRAAILLTAVEGVPYEDAAKTLGIPVGTLRSKIARGRDHLRILFVERERVTPLRRVK